MVWISKPLPNSCPVTPLRKQNAILQWWLSARRLQSHLPWGSPFLSQPMSTVHLNSLNRLWGLWVKEPCKKNKTTQICQYWNLDRNGRHGCVFGQFIAGEARMRCLGWLALAQSARVSSRSAWHFFLFTYLSAVSWMSACHKLSQAPAWSAKMSACNKATPWIYNWAPFGFISVPQHVWKAWCGWDMLLVVRAIGCDIPNFNMYQYVSSHRSVQHQNQKIKENGKKDK